ncbi:hypothetical protein L3V83_06745 [Thiotrichales bacterium 19X7-9]|nr:hypothetical protein [Thiotrichales bacterium 19X7-9]
MFDEKLQEKQSNLLKKEELLIIAAAMVMAIRKIMDLSGNQPSIIDEDIKDFHQRITKGVESRRKARGQKGISNQYYTREEAQEILNNRLGNCGELSLEALLLAEFINLDELGIKSEQPIYMQEIFVEPDHQMCILHQSQTLASLIKPCLIFGHLNQLIDHPELQNAILVDPWTYKATPVVNLKAHLMHAKIFELDHYYEGRVFTCNNIKKIINGLHSTPETYEEKILYHNFLKYYKVERDKAVHQPELLANGSSLDTVKQQYQLKQVIDKQLHDLKFKLGYIVKLSEKKRILIHNCQSLSELCAVASTHQESGFWHFHNTTYTCKVLAELLNSDRFEQLRISIYGQDVKIRVRDIRSIALGEDQRPPEGFFLSEGDKLNEAKFSHSIHKKSPSLFFEDYRKYDKKGDINPFIT